MSHYTDSVTHPLDQTRSPCNHTTHIRRPATSSTSCAIPLQSPAPYETCLLRRRLNVPLLNQHQRPRLHLRLHLPRLRTLHQTTASPTTPSPPARRPPPPARAPALGSSPPTGKVAGTPTIYPLTSPEWCAPVPATVTTTPIVGSNPTTTTTTTTMTTTGDFHRLCDQFITRQV